MGAVGSSSSAVLLRVGILALIALVAFSSRLFSVIRFESVIHEFDPWFNFRTTRELVNRGYYDFLNWFDDYSWYPLGRVVGGTVYPGIMVTAGALHWLLHALNLPIDIRNVCVFLAPLFSGLTALATYFFATELKDTGAGLLAAAFVGIAPGYISRSVAGSYDNEGVAITALQLVFFSWLRAVKTGSAYWGAVTALGYFYMVSAWGGYVFIINMIPLHVLVLVLMGRYTSRLYVAYCSFYVIGTLSSMIVPFIGFQPVQTSEHMAALGVFGLLQIIAFVEYLRTQLNANQFRYLLWALVGTVAIGAAGGLVLLTSIGVIRPWGGRFYSLWDTDYARKYIPIIASVSEHQPTPWTSFFFDLHFLVVFFPAGLVVCFLRLKDEHVFAILYGLFAAYFSGIMVRLMLTLTPIACVLGGVAVSAVLDAGLLDPPEPKPAVAAAAAAGKKGASKALELDIRAMMLVPLLVVLCIYPLHCTMVTSSAYSSPSIVLASRRQDGSNFIIDDFREAYFWLRQNTPEDAKIMSWWDYGYQITGMANRTVLVDNNTWNNTHIATVGKAMSCAEDVSYEVMRRHDVDYVLVIFGGYLGYSGDDINKFLWMIRIGQGVYPNDIKESKFFTSKGEYKVDDQATQTMTDSLMYKMSYYRFNELGGYSGKAQDRVRSQDITHSIHLDTIEEVYTTGNWIVRIYKVKDLDNLGRSHGIASRYDGADGSAATSSVRKPAARRAADRKPRLVV